MGIIELLLLSVAKGDGEFWHLKQAIDISYSMQMAQDIRLLKICNFCEKAFIANNQKLNMTHHNVRIKLMYIRVEGKLYLVM